MPPASSSKKRFSIGSFASPKTRTTPDPEALQRLMVKTEVDGGGVLGSTSDSEVVAKPPTAIHSVAREAEPELEDAPSTPEIAPPPVPTLPTGRSRGRGTKEEPRVRAKDGERLRQTSIHLPVDLHQRRSEVRLRPRDRALRGDGRRHQGVARCARGVGRAPDFGCGGRRLLSAAPVCGLDGESATTRGWRVHQHVP